jgi:hypothetical protein
MPRLNAESPSPVRVTATERQRIARRPKVAEEVTGPAALAFVMLLVGGIGYQFNAAALMIAGFGSLAVLAVLVAAYFVNSNRVIAELHDERTEPAQVEPVNHLRAIPIMQQGQPVTYVNRRVPITVVDNDFQWQFSLPDIDKLTAWLESDNRIRRDPNGDRPGMVMLDGVTTGNYDRLLLALKRAGLAAGQPNSSFWTEMGEAWIMGEIAPVAEVE